MCVCWEIEFNVETEVWLQVWNRQTEYSYERVKELEGVEVCAIHLFLNYRQTVRPIENKTSKIIWTYKIFRSANIHSADIQYTYMCLCMDCVQIQALAKMRGQAKYKQNIVCSFPCEWCWQFRVSISFLPPSFTVSFNWILRFVIVHFHSVLLALFHFACIFFFDAFKPIFHFVLIRTKCFAVATNNGFKIRAQRFSAVCSLENYDEIHDYFSTFQFITNLWAIFRKIVFSKSRTSFHIV